MTPPDVDAMEWALRGLSNRVRDVLVLSPVWDGLGTGVTELTSVHRVWPGLGVIEADRGRWDLDGPMPDGGLRADVAIACNTFMCSRDPALWLEHLSGAVPLLVVQDLAVCRRARGGSAHCDTGSGDVARYSVSTHGIVGETDPGLSVFDLGSCGHPVVAARGYNDGGSLKFVAVVRLARNGVP